MRRIAVIGALLALALPAAAEAHAPLPRGWPHRFAIGAMDGPGGAAALARRTHVAFRYQYLAGGVNTGAGWATWNPHGSFVTRYVRESRAAGIAPVLTYYQLLQSRPAAGATEAERDLANLRDPATMRAYFADLRLLLRRLGALGRGLVVVHVEPDLWGYLEQAPRGASTPAAVAASGDPALRGLPDTAAGFARAIVRLRDRLAPHVVLGWHLSVWGTKEDPTYTKPSLRHMAALAARSAAFYRSLHARFDVAFTDVADRDAGFARVIEGNPRTRWGPGDFRRHERYVAGFVRRTRLPMVVWQIPLGNASLPNTWGRFRDTRVRWWLGSRAHLRAERDAGVVALLFGGGADGTTSRTTDGGLFDRLARRYARHPLRPWESCGVANASPSMSSTR